MHRIASVLLISVGVLLPHPSGRSPAAGPRSAGVAALEGWGLGVSDDGRRIQKVDGSDWLWLADTAWSIFLRLDRGEVDLYLETRAEQGFNVIQCVVIMGYNFSWNAPNAYGRRPFIEGDPSRPDSSGADSFWAHADYIVDRARSLGLYVALLPAWGEWWRDRFTDDQAVAYATWIANRYKDRRNVIWVNGGDIDASDHQPRFSAIGNAIHEVAPHQLQTFHPRGGLTSASLFHDQEWLDLNMFQSGHAARDARTDDRVVEDWSRAPPKPTLDGEQAYEKHPINWDYDNPSFTAHDVRQVAYWSVLAGAAGVTYGHVSVWVFNDPDGPPEEKFHVVMDHSLRWEDEIGSEGAHDMGHLKALMMSRPHARRLRDQALLVDELAGPRKLVATRGDGYVFVYTSQGDSVGVHMDRIPWQAKKVWWFNPREGGATLVETTTSRSAETFDPPGPAARGNDYVLVIDDASRAWPPPGAAR